MNRTIISLLLLFTNFCMVKEASAQSNNLKIVFVRHAEKPVKGDNLTCQGLNRALQLPELIHNKFGVPNFLFAPGLGLGEATKHARMFETIAPLAIKYNLAINTSHAEKDSMLIAQDLKSRKGTIIVVWEHKAIAPIVRSLGVTSSNLIWPDQDYDSIWIVNFVNGKAVFTKDKEGLHPSETCNY